jgi:hypothetical protein
MMPQNHEKRENKSERLKKRESIVILKALLSDAG